MWSRYTGSDSRLKRHFEIQKIRVSASASRPHGSESQSDATASFSSPLWLTRSSPSSVLPAKPPASTRRSKPTLSNAEPILYSDRVGFERLVEAGGFAGS